jgi:lipocalin-like protein
MTGLAARLVGTWLLEAYEAEDPDGTVSAPFGPDATGLLVYGADGRMAVQVMDPRRPRWDRRASEADRRAQVTAAADGYIAYAGRFEVEETPVPTVLHHVEWSLVPNWVGRPQRRAVVLDGDRLRLTAQPLEVAGRTTIPRLTWRRDGAAGR